MRLDLTDLRLFAAVVDAGSITQGAVRVHLALPSASERLRAIETQVGAPLLVRHARGVRPTPAGEALAHHARRLLQQHADMQAELRALAQGERGSVRLFANTSAMTGFLPARLGPWLAQRPDLQLDVQERRSSDIVEAVAQGLVEAGVVASSVAAQGMALSPIADDQLVLVAARQAAGPVASALAPFASARALSFRDALAWPFVGLAMGSALQAHIDHQAAQLGAQLRYRLRVGELSDVLALLAQGLGVAVLPQRLVPRAATGLRSWRLRDAWCQRQLCICTRPTAALSLPMQALLAALQAGSPSTQALAQPSAPPRAG